MQALSNSHPGMVRTLWLPPNPTGGDLATLISRLREEIAPVPANPSHSIVFHVEVEGTPRPLDSFVSDETYRIAREALRNAYQHSHCTQIEIELSYHPRKFRLRVRDDGQGFNSDTLAARRRQRHFGLESMQERAELAGGKLTIWSALGAGTELELTIPATRAYTAAGD